MIITIDGPAGSGKSTAARLLAIKLSASFLDTGAMYRAVTLAAMQAGVNMSDEDELLSVVQTNKFEFSVRDDEMSVRINGIDFTEQLRSPQVTANARHIASVPKAREKLVQMQRLFAAGQPKIVTEGRDQGTVAFPDADIKFYLVADSTVRAKRRQADLHTKGVDQSLEQIQKAIEERDNSDRSRTVGPLKPADDAVIIDTTDLSIDAVVEKLLSCVKEKCLKKN
ncbi:MAG: (d)CMP kinase [Planctomycetota bacterium]|jgi:cytidylate kinase